MKIDNPETFFKIFKDYGRFVNNEDFGRENGEYVKLIDAVKSKDGKYMIIVVTEDGLNRFEYTFSDFIKKFNISFNAGTYGLTETDNTQI